MRLKINEKKNITFVEGNVVYYISLRISLSVYCLLPVEIEISSLHQKFFTFYFNNKTKLYGNINAANIFHSSEKRKK